MLLQMFIHANLGIHNWNEYTFKTFCHKMLIHTDQSNMCTGNINIFREIKNGSLRMFFSLVRIFQQFNLEHLYI